MMILLNELFAQNLLWAEWISFTASVSLFGILVMFNSHLVPEVIKRVFKYGKAAELHVEGIKILRKFELPKRWFYHFYLIATVFYSCIAYGVIQVYFSKQQVPILIRFLLDSCGVKLKATVCPESVVIVTILLLAQVGRRLTECTFLSVYSRSKMNIVHYIFGHSFYFGVGLSIIAEAPGFSGTDDVELTGDYFRWNHMLGVALFLAASYIQFSSHRILANLRRDATGRIVTLEHSIPRGSLFELISCPHYFAEILIYLSLCLVFAGQSVTWWFVCLFVLTNQVVVGLFNHHWYHQKFANYPKSRKALIPYLL